METQMSQEIPLHAFPPTEEFKNKTFHVQTPSVIAWHWSHNITESHELTLMWYFIALQGGILFSFCIRDVDRVQLTESESHLPTKRGVNPLHPTEECSPDTQCSTCSAKQPCSLFLEKSTFRPSVNDLECSIEIQFPECLSVISLWKKKHPRSKVFKKIFSFLVPLLQPWHPPQLCGRYYVRQCAMKVQLCGLTDYEVTLPDRAAAWRRHTSLCSFTYVRASL